MGTYKEIKGDLIALAKEGKFDVIIHGTNCFCTQGAGVALQMDKTFGSANPFTFKMENKIKHKGDINKLGTIDYNRREGIVIVNAYTQYNPGKDLDYNALCLCLKKMNHIFKGQHIGLPQIGCGIAGGVWGYVSMLIKENLKDCNITVVVYNK